MKNNKHFTAPISQAQLELGLLKSAIIFYANKNEINEAFDLLINSITNIEMIEKDISVISSAILNIAKGKVLLSCGMESIILDRIYDKYKSVIIVPNADYVNFERINNNYHKISTKVLEPIYASNLVNPDTTILVPVYPLFDKSYLTYRYSSKLLTIDAFRYAYQIIGIEICEPLQIQKGYDPSGLTDVMASIDKNYFTNILKLSELWKK